MVQPPHKALQWTAVAIVALVWNEVNAAPSQGFRCDALAIFMQNLPNFIFFDAHVWGRWKLFLVLLATWNLHTVYYTGWVVEKWPPIALKLMVCDLRWLNNIVKFTKVYETKETSLLGVLAAWKSVCERKCTAGCRSQYLVIRKDRNMMSLDVTFSGIISQKVNFSKLDSSRLLKMHKALKSGTLCTNMQDF